MIEFPKQQCTPGKLRGDFEMADALGWRGKFGVVTPSTNTMVQPEYDAMRPHGVTNHIARMHIPDDPVNNNDDFDELIRRIDSALEEAVDRVMTAKPDYLILGISSESIWGGGLEPSRRIAKRIRERLGYDIGIAQAADAFPAALKALGVRKRLAVVTPYFPVADKHIREYVEAVNYEVVRSKHLSCRSPTLIGHTSETDLRRAMQELDGNDIDGIIQFGANLPGAKVAAEAEEWLGKPVICVNVATYWYALRQNGIQDNIYGFGSLLAKH
jgi:maleate isomerase